ncbi:MAG: DUF4126 domain-containing protein [Gemmatimonadetes bacterium]|nr:DUF4126 domain-containing protein [Gemmatimonadota bacterium]
MSALAALPPELLALPPLALAAGVDLYLTLLFLGAAPALGWWTSLPGALGELSSPGVLAMVGSFYVLEFLAERWPSGALFWNAFHVIIRPLAGALLALLLLDGQPAHVQAVGAVVAGALAAGAHATRTGGGVLLWLDSAAHPNRLLVSLLEDVGVLGMVTLLLDTPVRALALSALVIGAASPLAASQVRAFAFTVRLAWGRVWGTLGQPRWDDPDAFPSWVRRALEGDVMAPGGGLRGSPAAGYRLPGGPRFSTGWVVVRGDTPFFLFPRRRRGAGHVDLGDLRATEVVRGAFFRRVKFQGQTSVSLYFSLGGPGIGSLKAEFLVP